MNTAQMNTLAMLRSSRTVLASTPATHESTVLADRLVAFDAKMEEIKTLEAQQAMPLDRPLFERDEAFTTMVEQTMLLVGFAYSHANAKNLGALAAVTRLCPTAFARGRFDARVQKAAHLAAVLREALPDLTGSGVTAETLGALHGLIDDAAEQLAAPRDTVISKRAATERLGPTIREATAILADWIDPLLVPLRRTDLDFDARYRAAREIVDRPATRASSPAEKTAAPTTVPAAREHQPLAA